MEQIYSDLWKTVPEKPFPDLITHAVLLGTHTGNILFYSTGHAEESEKIAALGGITRQHLSHRDEAGPALARIRERFGSMLCCHALEVEAIQEHNPVDLILSKRQTN